MDKKILTLILTLFFLTTSISPSITADEETIYQCGGDEQLVIPCSSGDEQYNVMPSEVPEGNIEEKLFFISFWMSMSLIEKIAFCLGILFLILILIAIFKRKKKKDKKG